MENYNLTAELKKIASGITSTDPNTELGNINSGVGNLDTAMQGVATAIGNISIPNPGTNIDGVATAIGNISIPNTGSNIDGVAKAINNKIIPDPTSELANITSALNNLSGMFGGKYYTKHIGPYSTNGNWGNYTQNTIQFNLPSGATGAGKTFMFIHSFRLQGNLNTNIESYLELPLGGTLWNPRHYTRATNYVWQTFNHIAFITANSSPIIRINVATSVAATNICYSYCTLIPLN